MSKIIQNSPPLRLGFIGGALNSAVGYTHWTACQIDQNWDVVSGCFSRTPETSLETGHAWNLADDKIYTDWQRYIAQEKDHLDCVVVLTPTPDHAPVVCALLDAGIGVICEKAMAADLEQSHIIQEALQRTNGFLAVTFNYSGYPMVRVLRRHVEAGDLGKLKQMQIEMPSDAFIQAEDKMSPQPWRLKDGAIPTILLDLAVHLHHLCGFVTDLSPLSVNADFHHDSIFDEIVDDAYMWVRYEQDFRASLWVSKSALGYRNGLKLRLFGEQGSAEWYQEEPEHLHLFAKNSTRTTYDRGNCHYPEEIRERFKPGHPGGFVEAFANLYADIAHSFLAFRNKHPDASSPYVYGWEHAHEGLKLLNGASLANREQRWIDLNQEV